MQNPVYLSPVAFAQQKLNPTKGVVNGMETALTFADKAVETARSELLSICDVSALNRFGVKGPNAAAWLTASNVMLPDASNSWKTLDNDALVMRLGNTEFLIEEPVNTTLTEQLNATSVDSGVHKVQRNDAAFIVSGKLAAELFSQVCAIDLMNGALEENRLVMTVIAGVSATMLKQTLNGQSAYRIWCDGTFGPYLWKTLLNIIEEQGGGAVGFSFYHEIN